MPPKQPNLTRAWGTRYDTLHTSPPVSPETKRGEEQQAFQEANTPPERQTKRKDDKLPHDASVFVGSLPSNVDQVELTRLLTGHLSQHAEIKSVKVIRDSKGGVCAFVQCEDAASASAFLQGLQSKPPKPFLGRILRYEPARAFRTLLISYRTPSQAIVPGGIGRASLRAVGELELPHAIRIWKPKTTKYHRILYNVEAIEAERYTRTLAKEDTTSEREEAVYVQPLRFDAESIVKLARYFGPVEKVSKLTEAHELVGASRNGNLGPESYPPPHNTTRSKSMDTGCWEIKWDHRDDCVTALMVLRRVPHLSVSWAHHPQAQHTDQRCHLPGYQHTPNHVPCTLPRMDRFQSYSSPDFTPLLGPDNIADSQQRLRLQALDKHGPVIHAGPGFGADDAPSWTNRTTPPGLIQEAPTTGNTLLSETRDKPLDSLVAARIDWVETDFPSFVESEYDSKLDWSAWGGSGQFEKQIGHPSPPSVVASQSTTHEMPSPGRLQIPFSLASVDEVPTPGLAMSPPTPRTTLPQTPITPTNQPYDGPFSGYRPKCGSHEHNDNREFDPTTLFVGGLETYGPGGWTEEKVHSLFGRFKGLEYVRMVRPPNGNTAFAFVKYNNTHSPTQAILEENNRVYAGRALKVQLRDINPPRSPWKHNRGRSRFSNYQSSRKAMVSQHPEIQKQGHLPGSHSTDITAEVNKITAPDPNPANRIENENARRELVTVDKQQQEGPMTRVLESAEGEKYREWYDTPVAGSSSESGSGSNGFTAPIMAAPTMPYPVPGYYPMPWIHPYAQPGHYPMSYYGPYPGYPMAVPLMQPPSSDANGSAVGGHLWNGMMYNAFTPCGPTARPAVEQQSPPASGQAPQSPQTAPLAPSGFIQHDHGTLIAVYPPDALDQYMSGQSNDSNSSSSAPSISTVAAWPSIQTLPGSVSSFSVGSQPIGNPHRLYPTAPNHPLWNSVPPPFTHIPGLVPQPATPTYNANAASRTGEWPDQPGTNSPSNFGRKQGNRKDFHQQHINRPSHAFHGRNGRGHLQNQNLTGNTEGVNSHYRNSQFVNTFDWSHYARR